VAQGRGHEHGHHRERETYPVRVTGGIDIQIEV
jgi:hypothetical protein